MTQTSISSAAALAEMLAATGYLADEGLATVGYLALSMERPLLLEGEPGTGKTSLAEALAEGFGLPLMRLQCYEDRRPTSLAAQRRPQRPRRNSSPRCAGFRPAGPAVRARMYVEGLGYDKLPSHRDLGRDPADAPATAPAWSGTVTASDRRRDTPEHPWRGIGLDVYEKHMSDARVGQLQRLHDITGDQLAVYPSRAIGVLGVAGGNGLDLINPETTDAVYGYDINADYLAACEARHRDHLGDRLHLIETSIDRTVAIQRVDLLIANLIIEYVGAEEFVAFAAANARFIGVLSSVIQRNDAAGFVSPTEYTSSFDSLASVSSDIDPEALDSALSEAGFAALGRCEYPLPNGKTLIRQDFRPVPHVRAR